MSEATFRTNPATPLPTAELPRSVAGYQRRTMMVPCSLTRSGRFVRIRDARHPDGRTVTLLASETFVEVRCGGRYIRLWAVDELDGLHQVELPNGKVLWVNTAEGLIERRKRAEKRKRLAKSAAKRSEVRVESLSAVA